MAAAALRPPGLPPAALLCVRRLRDPLPGELRLDGGALRPPVEWERAAVDALARTAATAARPARGPVPPGAEAVLFADRAELLASLAHDSIAGELGSRWWWPLLLHVRLPGAADAAAAWVAAPEHVPAALELLAQSREAVPFVARLSHPDVVALLEAVAAAHAVPLRQARMAAVARAPTARRAARPPAGGPRPRPTGAAAAGARGPWRSVAPESAEPGLAPAAAALLGLALALVRAPAVARAPSTAAAVARSLEPEAAPRQPAAAPSREAPQREGTAHPAVPPPVETAAPAAVPPEQPPPANARLAAPAPPAAATPSARAPLGTPPAAAAATPAARETTAPAAPPQPAGQPQRRPAPVTRAAPEPEPLLAGTRTELGGLFYLLNLALALGLYGDFTRPLDRPLRLDPWDLVALLGRELLRGEHPRDPVWALLARLAVRGSDDAPGMRFRPPRDLRLPTAWLEPFAVDDTPWRYATTGGRLRVQHPAQFTVLDLRLGHNPEIHLARALRPYGRPACTPGLFRHEPPCAPRDRWLGRLTAYARARLRLALAVDDRALAQTLLVQPARVFVTATHVDVVAELEHLAVEVRVAGLDRDPGWIPAAGRDVRFHFE